MARDENLRPCLPLKPQEKLDVRIYGTIVLILIESGKLDDKKRGFSTQEDMNWQCYKSLQVVKLIIFLNDTLFFIHLLLTFFIAASARS